MARRFAPVFYLRCDEAGSRLNVDELFGSLDTKRAPSEEHRMSLLAALDLAVDDSALLQAAEVTL